MTARGDSGGDRYEPLPSLPALPRWIWQRLPTPARVALGLLPLVAIVLIVLLAPRIAEDKDERSRSEQRRLAAAQAERVERLREEQRPRFARADAVASTSAAAGAQMAGRERALEQVDAAVLADARERGLRGPLRRTDCEPFPRTVEPSGAERDLGRRYGSYSCLVVTADIRGGDSQGSGVIGHPYRVLIDFSNGRFAFCKVTGRAGEGAIGETAAIGVPRACGGR